MAVATLTGDPVLQSVSVRLNLETALPPYICHCVFKSYSGATPIWTEVDVDLVDETMPADYFSHTVKAALEAALLAVNFAPSGDFALPPIATTLTIWDPTTNAPYP